jgi:hypothetical protein
MCLNFNRKSKSQQAEKHEKRLWLQVWRCVNYFYTGDNASAVGLVVWVFVSQIFHNRLRGIGMATVIFFLWTHIAAK